jgi:acyl dehydratase
MPQISRAELPQQVGKQLPPSPWLAITQEQVDRFADVTIDHQFIHVDPDKAAATPFGGTVAHGFLTLSLLTYLNSQNALLPEGLMMVVNYGSDKVRFLAPVRVGKRIRSLQKIVDVQEKKPNQWLIKSEVTVEIEDEGKPALVAEMLALYVLADA